MKKLKQIFHPYHLLEDIKAGMWRKVSGEEATELKTKAANLMKSPSEFKDAMLEALDRFPFACESNFTAAGVNKQAWIGHAGCVLATGSPEEITRSAWWTLNQEQQDAANKAADEVIEEWNKRHAENTARDECA